jgi:protein-L-isoaspartate(D-aspartate) O-methyltransferase
MVEQQVRAGGVQNLRVIESMLRTPRHEFVPVRWRDKAYDDLALPIGDRQTISSPFIVAFMTEVVDPQPTDKVLEIGTGSGYQAAVLSPLVKEVYTIEIVEALALRARETLQRLGYQNVLTKVGDGYQGWPEHAPYDKIIVTCSPEKVPQPLADQLKEGGAMVIPVGQSHQQTLYVFRKAGGRLVREALRPTLFVAMTGQAERIRRVRSEPARPGILNGGFEEPAGETPFVPGWYYQRQLTWEADRRAPEGRRFITFHNEVPGRSAHLLQGFAMDGRRFAAVTLTCWVKFEDVKDIPSPSLFPAAAVCFYDERHELVHSEAIGPFQGAQSWRRLSRRIRVPVQAREAIVQLGLFGATGELSFDDVRLALELRPGGGSR